MRREDLPACETGFLVKLCVLHVAPPQLLCPRGERFVSSGSPSVWWARSSHSAGLVFLPLGGQAEV